ncbi:unnamed protein product [Cylindrotheca closterium]|uniref:Lon N-terminal domain-containing protein n=1 Tax=Cylindrotheca closterium TaxID=2856 RepID=A0AAD2FNG5_9STRA|nr:unnamed protein product [Cylindrotheca closterium]
MMMPSISNRNHHQQHLPFRRDVSLHAYIRPNLQSIAEQRYHQPAYQNVRWIDPSVPTSSSTSTISSKNDSEDATTMMTVPIYPIPAVYLPIGNHTLNNVEPRNLQMALDLNVSSNTPPLFCVTLMAADTGKIATTGTLLRVTDMEAAYDPLLGDDGDGNKVIRRITVYCQSEGVVDICGIDNPEAACRKQRLMRSSEYLKGPVRIRQQERFATTNGEKLQNEDILNQMSTDFRLLKTMYELGIWAHEMPPNALVNLAKALPDDLIVEKDSNDSTNIWQAAQVWQSLCLTIQAGRQQLLNSDRNELMVEAATKNGGPLKLPIHLEDLDLPARRRVQELETKAEQDFLQLQLDPVLDFLALLSLDSPETQLKWLGEMVARERRRMEQAALEYTTSGSLDEELDDTIELQEQERTPQKGAWFDDDLW